jgi:hypothetical protein
MGRPVSRPSQGQGPDLCGQVGQGDLTPTEAGELTKMVQASAKIIETAELEERVRKLEEAIDK